jgi:hypothetical protein
MTTGRQRAAEHLAKHVAHARQMAGNVKYSSFHPTYYSPAQWAAYQLTKPERKR